MTHTEELATRWTAVMMNNYRTPPVALARGAGARVWDVDGRTPHALLLEMFTTEGTGTMVVPTRASTGDATTGEEPA